MTLFVTGKTICPICRQTIVDKTGIVAFPAFLPNDHEFATYSDAAFHRKCFEKTPHHEEVQNLYKRYREIWESRPRDLNNLDEIEAWGREAFKDFP